MTVLQEYIALVQQRFNLLPRREQILLAAVTAVLLVWLVIVLLWRPLDQARDTLSAQNQAAGASLANVRALAAQLRGLEQSGASRSRASGESLPTIVDNSVAANQLKMKRFQPSASGDVQVRFENAVFNQVLAWLLQLEMEEGVSVRELSITQGSGSGLVNVSVRLHQG